MSDYDMGYKIAELEQRLANLENVLAAMHERQTPEEAAEVPD